MKPVLNGTSALGKLVFSGKLLQSRGSKLQVPVSNGTYLKRKNIGPVASVIGRFHCNLLYYKLICGLLRRNGQQDEK